MHSSNPSGGFYCLFLSIKTVDLQIGRGGGGHGGGVGGQDRTSVAMV